MNSFLRWAGSKRRIVPSIMENIRLPIPGRYIEPFAGSACLFFRLQPNAAILGDINEELINTYTQIKSDPLRISKLLTRVPQTKTKYFELRQQNPARMGLVSRAVRFIYLNRFCFNGLYRTNSSGKFNVPYGASKAGNLPTAEHLSACSQLLQRAELYAGDFENVLRQAEPGDFVYLDPPYVVENRRIFREYAATTFDHYRLATIRSWIEKLSAKGISFVVSYAYCNEAKKLAVGFRHEIISVQRNIAGFAKNRRISKELLIYP